MAKTTKPEPKITIDLGEVETFEVDLFDALPVQVNGSLTLVPKGKSRVTQEVYNVLKDANLA